MDPLTALLFSLWIAGYFTKNVYQDAVFRARGEDPPSFRREMARWERRQARAAQRGEDGPGRRFWRNVWADAVASAEERRERAAAKAKQRRRAKWTDEDIAAAEDEAHKVNERLDAGAPAETPAAPDRTPASASSETSSSPCHFCSWEFPPNQLWPDRDGDTPVDTCIACWNRRHRPAEPTEDDHSTPSASADPAPGDAEIIQFADWQRPAASDTEKEPDMSAEITGLQSAITFAEGSAAAAEKAAAQDELAITNLEAGGTTGAAIAALQAARDAHQVVAGHYRTAAQELTRHLGVTEQYQANQGAGTREFVTAE